MAAKNDPFEDELDGIDISCTHLPGHVGESPAGCLRTRAFSSLATIERLTITKRTRNTRPSNELINAAIELCRKKGHRHNYGCSDEHVVRPWQRQGFSPQTANGTIFFSKLHFDEGDLELNISNDALG